MLNDLVTVTLCVECKDVLEATAAAAFDANTQSVNVAAG